MADGFERIRPPGLSARQFAARLNAAAKAFKAAGGTHPFVRIDGDRIEIVERPPGSTDEDRPAKNQSLLDARLGGKKSAR